MITSSRSSPRIFSARDIVTLDGTNPGALATVGPWIVASGELAHLRTLLPAAEIIDLDDGVIFPGFNDAHCHPSLAAMDAVRLNLAPGRVNTVADVRRQLAHAASQVPAGAWIIAQGYNPARMPHGYSVDRWFLDSVSTDHRIAIVLSSVHAAITNSAGLQEAGYVEDSSTPPGGQLGRDGAGALNGWLYERAWLDLWLPGPARSPWIPAPSAETLVEALAGVNRRLHSAGLTSYCDALVSPSEWRLYDAARRANVLTPRVGMLLWHSYTTLSDQLGMGAGFGDERLRFVGTKLMLDGSLSGGTCLCVEPYSSASGGDNGIQLLSEQELGAIVDGVHRAGGRVAVHANGDRAVELAVGAIESARASLPANGVSHRIEHCSLVNDNLIERIAKANITVLPFGAFINYHGNALRHYYGDDRARSACAHGSFLRAGVTVAGASDHPVGPVEPLPAIQTMVTRETDDGTVLGPDQRLSPLQALQLYTAGSAAATGESHIKGMLAPGYLADFTVLGRNVLQIDPHEIADTPVLSTWVGAECVWSSDEQHSDVHSVSAAGRDVSRGLNHA